MSGVKLLFVVEGFTDIRFVLGLSEIADVTLIVPARHCRESELDKRIAESRPDMVVHTVDGDRLQYQIRCLEYLLRNAHKFDVILSQEMLRGSLNACIAGRLRSTPVVTYTCLPALQYYRCRRERKQVGPIAGKLGEVAIQALTLTSARLASCCIALGPYLTGLVSRYGCWTEAGFYYGVDTDLYHPVTRAERLQLRTELGLPHDKFIVFLSSRIAHEKDPETVLRAVALARKAGLDAIVINLSGGYKEFLRLSKEMGFADSDEYVLGRPAAHPMQDLPNFYQAADCTALASLEEGLGMSPLESLACATPAVCTAVGGLRNLEGYARLIPRSDAAAMAEQLVWISRNGEEARVQALKGREFVKAEWSREKAFTSLWKTLSQVVHVYKATRRTRV